MAHRCEEAGLRIVCALRLVARFSERKFRRPLLGYVMADALDLAHASVGRDDGEVLPYEPARPRARRKLDQAAMPLLIRRQHVCVAVHALNERQCEHLAHRLVALDAERAAEGIVGEGEAVQSVAPHDDVALMIEKIAIACFAFAHLPLQIAQRLEAFVEMRAKRCEFGGVAWLGPLHDEEAEERRAEDEGEKRKRRACAERDGGSDQEQSCERRQDEIAATVMRALAARRLAALALVQACLLPRMLHVRRHFLPAVLERPVLAGQTSRECLRKALVGAEIQVNWGL